MPTWALFMSSGVMPVPKSMAWLAPWLLGWVILLEYLLRAGMGGVRVRGSGFSGLTECNLEAAFLSRMEELRVAPSWKFFGESSRKNCEKHCFRGGSGRRDRSRSRRRSGD